MVFVFWVSHFDSIRNVKGLTFSFRNVGPSFWAKLQPLPEWLRKTAKPV